MKTVADWLLGQIDTYGIGPVLATEAAGFLAIYCGIGAACQAVARHRTRHHLPAAPDNQPGRNVTDLWTCRHAWNATDIREEKP